MSRLFAIGDLHLSHASDKPMERFGQQWTNHVSLIKKHWEMNIREEDIICVVGDISWAKRLEEAKMDLDWLDNLPGRKICIRGNHDYWWGRVSKLESAYPEMVFLQNKSYAIGDISFCGTRGWQPPPKEGTWLEEDQRLYEREIQRLALSLNHAMENGAREICVLLHYPPTSCKERSSPLMALLKEYPVTRVIYGHLHDELSWQDTLMGDHEGISFHLASADYLKFCPIRLL